MLNAYGVLKQNKHSYEGIHSAASLNWNTGDIKTENLVGLFLIWNYDFLTVEAHVQPLHLGFVMDDTWLWGIISMMIGRLKLSSEINHTIANLST
jgi:hypothetical protein